MDFLPNFFLDLFLIHSTRIERVIIIFRISGYFHSSQKEKGMYIRLYPLPYHNFPSFSAHGSSN
uniref:ORF63e n=1 Tax=Pinus koraiensis TaxID=88728 RepID=Q85WT9_PINKO|nr:ORF63e [Pinus koraiensis]